MCIYIYIYLRVCVYMHMFKKKKKVICHSAIVYYAIVISNKHPVSGPPALGSRTPVAWSWVREGRAWPSNPPREWWAKAAPKALEGAGFLEGWRADLPGDLPSGEHTKSY